MAENFWDILEGRSSGEASTAQAAPSQAAPSQAAPSQAAPSKPEPASPSAKKRPVRDTVVNMPPPEQLFDAATFQPSAERVAGRVAATASAMKQQMPEATAASPTKDFMDNILSLWQIPAALAGYEVAKRGIKAFKKEGEAAKTKSILDSDIQFNMPAETDAMPKPSAPAPAPTQTVMTAGGPVNLREVPPEMREMIERSAQVTQQKMTAAPIAPSATPAAATQAGIAPMTKQQESFFKWFKGSYPELGITTPEQYQQFVKSAMGGKMPAYNAEGVWPEYRANMAKFGEENMLPFNKAQRDALRAQGVDIPSKTAVPPQAPKTTPGSESQKGSASMGAMANTALNAAGGLLLLDMFKKARETGDYSDFALGAIGQVLGNVAPRAANVGYMLMQPNTVSSGTLDSPEAQEMMRRRNAGAGRGFVNPPQFR